jgi:hypothetical protein
MAMLKGVEKLSKAVGNLVRSRHIDHLNFAYCLLIPIEVTADVNVLCAAVKLGVLRQLDCCTIVLINDHGHGIHPMVIDFLQD